MATPYSQDLRDRVLAAYDRGMKTGQIAETFAVSPAWTRRVKQRRREHGETSPRKMGGRRTVKIERKRLRELVAERPDATLNELRDALGVECGISAVWAALKAMGLSFKKRRSMPPNRTAPMLPSDERTGKQGKGSSTQAA